MPHWPRLDHRKTQLGEVISKGGVCSQICRNSDNESLSQLSTPMGLSWRVCLRYHSITFRRLRGPSVLRPPCIAIPDSSRIFFAATPQSQKSFFASSTLYEYGRNMGYSVRNAPTIPTPNLSVSGDSIISYHMVIRNHYLKDVNCGKLYLHFLGES